MQRLEGGVALDLNCCGAPAYWAGNQELATETADDFLRRWQNLGQPRVILACPTCQKMLAECHPSVPSQSLWEVIGEKGLPDTCTLTETPLALFDPCASRYDADSQQAVRDLLSRAGVAAEELPDNRRHALCCGYGGLAYGAHPKLTAETVNKHAHLSDTSYVTYCTNCRDAFSYAGKRTYHILDILFGLERKWERPQMGIASLSDKRDNRRKLKCHLLTEIWGEPPMEPMPRLSVLVDDDLRLKMDKQLILLEDIEEVIRRAEETGEKLRAKDGSLIAHLRIGIITYWVQYAPTEGGAYRLYNAYSHRMKIEGCEGEQS
jgi:glutamate synthase (NADPH/NADH) small chain